MLVDAAEDDVVESAVVEASEHMDVSRREEELGRDDDPSTFLCCSGREVIVGLISLVTALSFEHG